MSNFRIQRKLTEGSGIKMKPALFNPYRVKSMESRQNSFSRSPKRIDSQQLRKLVKKNSSRQISQQSICKTKMEDGIRAYKEKDVSKALELFKEAQKGGNKSAQLFYHMGSCLLNMGKHEASIRSLNECISANEKYNPNAYLYIAVNFKLMGKCRQAVRVLQEGLDIFPNFEEGQFYKAKLEMKLGDVKQAVESFTRCLQINSSNQLATIFLGDCLKLQGNTVQAHQKYKRVQTKGKKYNVLAGIRTGNFLIQKDQFQQAFQQLMKILSKGQENSQINYLLGLSCWGSGRKQESIVYLQSCISASKDMGLAVKALKALIISSVEEVNFFEAERHINRIVQLGLKPEPFTEWKLFVEGVNDSIKRKDAAALSKLQKALESSSERQNKSSWNQRQSKAFKKNIYPYLAYALHCNHKIVESIRMYSKAIELNPHSSSSKYAKLVAEGLQLHEKKSYNQAINKFKEAFQVQNRPQSYFLLSISLVQQFKTEDLQKQQVFEKVQSYLQKGRKGANQYPLMLFYHSLVRLFQGKNCIQIIQRAIDLCEDPVSQYHFIEALALKQTGKLSKSVEAISKAIDIDPGIEQFYRQRSKYYFLAEEYHIAIEDCLKAEMMAPEDEQLPLLLSFYYYLTNEYVISFNYLQNVKSNSSKLCEFQEALELRLGKYNKLGAIGNLIRYLKEEQIMDINVLQPIEEHIKTRYQYSQFSVYFYHLILSVGYAKLEDYERALSHLFGCLEQIQMLIDERDSKQASYEVTWQQTEAMLDQIKFNIVIVSLMKQNHEEAQHFIKVFVNETDSQQLKQILITILKIMESEEGGETKLLMDDDEPRISDAFPNISIPVNHRTITTKLLVSYPVKLKFSISPEFDPAYLLNFDIDKIQYKIPPPWLKTPTNRVNFTNSVRNVSVLLTESQISEKKSTPKARTIRDHLKLDEAVEAKLNRLIKH